MIYTKEKEVPRFNVMIDDIGRSFVRAESLDHVIHVCLAVWHCMKWPKELSGWPELVFCEYY